MDTNAKMSLISSFAFGFNNVKLSERFPLEASIWNVFQALRCSRYYF